MACVCVLVKKENGWEKEPLYTITLGDIYYGLLTFIKYRASSILTSYVEGCGEGLKRKGCHCLLGSHDDYRNHVSHGWIHDWVKFRSNSCLLGLWWRVFDRSDDKKSHYYSNLVVFERKYNLIYSPHDGSHLR